MFDYIKLRIEDPDALNVLLNHPSLSFTQSINKTTGEVFEYPQISQNFFGWQVTAHSSTRIEITGSLHKFYTGGYNYDDFSLDSVIKAVDRFSKLFKIQPNVAKLVNLEFGVNIRPTISASEIIDQVICCSNKRPIRPYEDKPNCYYMEFQIGESYVKLYDKGKQYGVTNTLRFEVKAMRSRYLQAFGLSTFADLVKPQVIKLLGRKINQVYSRIVFKDDTIDLSRLSKADRNVYTLMKDPNEWVSNKGSRTSTHRNRATRFRQVVAKYGRKELLEVKNLISTKVNELGQNKTWLEILPEYTLKNNQSVGVKKRYERSVLETYQSVV